MKKILCSLVQLFLTQSQKHWEAPSWFMLVISTSLSSIIILLFYDLSHINIY